MKKEIYLDCDGTFINLYGVENWLQKLQEENVSPYIEAKPLVNLSMLARTLNTLQRKGYTINIISWTSKNCSEQYHDAIKQAKLKWLSIHLKSVQWDNIHIVKYGTPKNTIGKGILFDDEENNRKDWDGIAYSEKNLIENLRKLA